MIRSVLLSFLCEGAAKALRSGAAWVESKDPCRDKPSAETEHVIEVEPGPVVTDEAASLVASSPVRRRSDTIPSPPLEGSIAARFGSTRRLR